jgi:NAD(P)-dependent dehydrogenase (short-subunit alcohol dehydrogenase family)
MFTESIRAEFRSRGVSATAICPGFVSDAGMYAVMEREAGVKASLLAGTSSGVPLPPSNDRRDRLR